MKKGLLTLLAASLVFVGCQNYDDQFDDLNAQISALKSQVDGLSSLSGQVASLSGSISGLQAGVAAAQASASSAASAATAAGASADAATAAANANAAAIAAATAAAEAAGASADAATAAATAATDAATAAVASGASNAEAIAAATAAATAAGASADAATAAATAATDAATAAGTSASANTADLSTLASSLATLAADVAAVQASLATAATAEAVTALQAEIDAIEKDLDDLLASSNIYSTDVSVTNATTLNSALALGNKVNVLNATLTITGYANMDYAKVQQLVDRVNTTTGNIVYSAYSSTGTEIVFNNLTSAGDIDMTQPGGYSFPKLANASTINLQNDYKTTVTNISFPVLTTVTDLQTEGSSTDKFTVDFSSATNVDFGSLATTPGTTVEITTKKGATLDLGSWVAKDASGNYISTTLTLNGPASFTNGTAAGTFTSAGLPGNTLGAHEGTINLTNVATAAVHNFRGTLNVNAGVSNFTGNNIVSLDTAGNDLVSVDLTFIRNNTTDLDATAKAALNKSSSAAQDLSFGSSHAKLTSIKVAGEAGDLIVNAAPVLTTIDLTGANMFDLTIHNNTALTSYTGPAKAEDLIFDNNDVLTSLSLSHTTSLTVSGDKAVSASIDGNAELTTLTLGFDKAEVLSVQSNAKLATINGTALKGNGTSSTTAVDIDNNAFVASLVRDTRETDAVRNASGWAVGAAVDTGSITTTSGLKTLDTFLDDAVNATGTVSVWFDEITKAEVQSTYGGTWSDITSSLGTVAYTKVQAQVFTGAARTGYYAYVYASEAGGTEETTGKISNQVVSYAFDRVRDANTLGEKVNLGTGEGFAITTGAGTFTFADGDAYASAANSSTVETVTDLMNYVNADSGLNNAANIQATVAMDSYRKAAYTISYTNSTGANAIGGVVSTGGNLYFTFGTDSGTGATVQLTASLTAGDSEADLAEAVRSAINGHADYAAVTATGNGNSNRFYVTKNVSGTGTMNMSNEITASSFPTIDFSTGVATTTAVLVASGYNTVMKAADLAAGSASDLNARGTASSFFSLPDQTGTLLSGLRLTLRNDGTTALSSSTTVTIAGASGTAIVSGSTAATNGMRGLIKAGVNISSYVADTNETPALYVAAFGDIADGTTTDTTYDAVTITKTGW